VIAERQRRAARAARENGFAVHEQRPPTGVRQPPLAFLGQIGNRAAAREIARLRTAQRQVSRFESLEHKRMGDLGAGGATMELAPGMTVTFGDMTALAGDYFGSLKDLQDLAKTPGSAGAPFSQPGTVDEVKYALYVEVQGTMKKDQFDEKVVNGAKKRYFNLAAHNESHFSRPDFGDDSASQQALAAKGGANNAGSYRGNHDRAIDEAVRAGTGMCRPLDQAMLQEAFGSHFLTDAFSAGHMRTPRHFVGEWWNPKVPMFWHNLKLWLAESIAWHLNENSTLAGVMTVNYLWHQAIDTLEKVMKAKNMPDLQFGDALSGALHDQDNESGVQARVGADVVKLFGDGQVLDEQGRDLLQGHQTMELAGAAVKVSINDINDAYWAATKGQTDPEAVKQSLKTPDGLYKAEQGWPHALPDAQQGANPSIPWMVNTVAELFTDKRMRAALTLFAHKKAGTLGDEVELDPPLKLEKQAALKWTLEKLKQDEDGVMKVFQQIIDYTPGLVTAGSPEGEGDLTGLFGDTSDDNARDYYKKAKATPGGLASLSVAQRIRLIRLGLDGPTLDDDEEMIVGLLSSNKSHVVPVLDAVGWRSCWDDIDGDECRQFINVAGPTYWTAQSYARKRAEVKYLADGATGEIAEETIIIILRTCTGAEVRKIDDEVGGTLGLSWDLDGAEQDEFDRLKARP
jgi:hypothetical protein